MTLSDFFLGIGLQAKCKISGKMPEKKELQKKQGGTSVLDNIGLFPDKLEAYTHVHRPQLGNNENEVVF